CYRQRAPQSALESLLGGSLFLRAAALLLRGSRLLGGGLLGRLGFHLLGLGGGLGLGLGLLLGLLGVALHGLLGDAFLRSLFLGGSLLRRGFFTLGGRSGFFSDRSRLIEQLHECHRRGIARTRVHAQDAGVTTRTRLETRTERLEQLHDHFGIAQQGERAAAI